jgi:hypothetical protein
MEYVGMHLLLLHLHQLTLLDHLQLLKIVDQLQLLVHHQFRYRLVLLPNIANTQSLRRHFPRLLLHPHPLLLRTDVQHLLEVLHTRLLNSTLHVPEPLLKLYDVVRANVETLELRLRQLHHHLHHPTEMLFIP